MYIKRKLEAKILSYLQTPEIIVVLGPRQCGKTTLLKEVSRGLENCVFISFEDQAALQLFEGDYDGFVSRFIKGNSYLFIDEFQYSKNGGKILKRIYDNEKIKIIITGSSMIDLTVNTVKFLVGRIFIFSLYPFDFEEFLSSKNAALLNIIKKEKEKIDLKDASAPAELSEPLQKELIKYFEEYAVFGGYPRAVLAATYAEKQEILINIYNTFFLREVKDILGLIDDYKLTKLLKGLALQAGNLIEYRELSQLSEYAHPTLKKYLNFLEKAFICQFIRPYFKNKRKEIVKNPKVFFLDGGLRNAVIGDFRPISDRVDAGALLENAAFAQLLKTGAKINYWRDKNGNEIDFIADYGGGRLFAVEVKGSAPPARPPFSVFRQNYPEIDIFFVYLTANKKQIGNNHIKPIYLL
ncbi:MAG: hypothetical protein A3J65_01355 [Candidatus Buchananbacteria bacterium RIFCSPHIGHO2_02_FULL_45_11b]|uniref:AAA+ ATPase domain-containing protein n=3 Tax=Candidatus Buchananiibacteriota TaxID=1817903 RepID=A0A1G1YMF4_9BACT|nr:MAG: hypothetical protein A2663_03060 [Candidatus Buchananbacteria bacterium RIFCSPHIGHO2_01_FULL_46_12]OGY50678.1 MAG: hypothetical protein A3J65_01355 [Candidatus Buchananbacteria bacterium RIFCSPHIGHO2_02_FULL_45_11b]OGY53542.1 MAG: hypothetical protein A3B15_03110 [Candidatus Buchananbacteria bacterium RIFCSPLOWO2_01_FULL_45_31]